MGRGWANWKYNFSLVGVERRKFSERKEFFIGMERIKDPTFYTTP
jgi:hypothetical protein